MKHTIRFALATLAAATAAFSATALAHADNNVLDPHIPNTMNGWCPGGGSGGVEAYGFCDGAHYPDGSFWHVTRDYNWFVGWQTRMDCVMDNGGNPNPPPAPPGGCGGAG